MCGRKGHYSAKCRNKDHPDANQERLPWKTSAKEMAWMAKGENLLLNKPSI
jgi:hypothetical protein